jgi:hypothetical protein
VLKIVIFRVSRDEAERRDYDRVRCVAQIAARLTQNPQVPDEVAASSEALWAWIQEGADPDDIQRRFDAAWMQHLNRSKALAVAEVDPAGFIDQARVLYRFLRRST